MWCEDTLKPIFTVLEIKCQIREFLQDIYELEKTKGESEKTKQSKERFEKMLEHCEYLDKISNQNNAFQLTMRHQNGKLQVANRKIKELEKQIEANRKAFEA